MTTKKLNGSRKIYQLFRNTSSQNLPTTLHRNVSGCPSSVLKPEGLGKAVVALLLFFSLSVNLLAQDLKPVSDSTKLYVSIESDPAFWLGTLPNGLGFDANIDFRLAKKSNLRFGILIYSGKWSGDFGKTLLLNDDFVGSDWSTQWNGAGIEGQYQFRFGLVRGGLQPGIRLQYNQFLYSKAGLKKGEAHHFVITPQIGYQWFPFRNLGLYLLPWAGVQIPTLGTNNLVIDGAQISSRKIMPVVTAHLGWEFNF